MASFCGDWGSSLVIPSAAEFVRLRFSEDPEEYRRAASEPAELAVWLDVIENYPEARFWVSHNKTVARHRNTPRAVIEELTHDRWSTVAETATERLKTLG